VSELSDDQLARYHSEGFLVWPGIFDESLIADICRKAEQLSLREDLQNPHNMRCRFKTISGGETRYLEAIDPISDLLPATRQVIENPRLKQALADIYQEPAHCLKDKLLFKPPYGEGYTLHQDYISWPDFPESCVIALIALDASGEEQGGLEVFPGWHTRGVLGSTEGNYEVLSEDLFVGTEPQFVQLNPGDVLFFSCMLPHRSGINRGTQQRRHLYLSYNAHSDGGDMYDRYYELFQSWFKERYDAQAFFA